MKVTYYLEILSSWCHWAEPAWDELKRRYEGRVTFDWRIALMNPADFPVSRSQCDWFYRRSGTIRRSPYMLNSGWFEPELRGDYTAPNLVAEACRELGHGDDATRRAIANAALRDGRKIGRMVEAAAVAAAATGLDAAAIESCARSSSVEAKVAESTAAFHAHQVSQRPTFVLEDPIADKVVISGLVTIEPLAAAIEAMLADSAAYVAHRTHFGEVPAS
jgi:predicted DsbA family dithiol-disulfide isomerase